MTQEKAYENYKEEAEAYFLTTFLDGSPKIKERIMQALNVVLNLDKNPIKKGLVIYSKSWGQGKTLFFDIVYARAFRVSKKRLFKKTTAKELREVYAKNGLSGLKEFINCKDLFIDDLGDEEEEAKHFGDDLNVLKYVILNRYEMWISKDFQLYLTTNLSIKEIAERYDGRVADRLLQMTETVEFDFIEGSFRQVKNSRRLGEEEKKKEIVVEKKVENYDKEYLIFLDKTAEEVRKGIEIIAHWSDFWVMYLFFERKGFGIRKPNEEDRAKAILILKQDKVTNAGKRTSIQEIQSNIKKLDPYQVENATLSVIGREYFTKLAKENFKFSETNNLSEL
ncbi:hypothetical protein F132_55 [Flavobacterium sp. phage 1/32]|nr:hypothetical protein F132_55 [Flavobacterium sp. phage 1/32]